MVFTIDLSPSHFYYPPNTEGGGAYTDEQIEDAVRYAVTETMKRMTHKLTRMTTNWKSENVPKFTSNFSKDQQLGLKKLDRVPITFELEKKRIWNLGISVWDLLDTGARQHYIKQKIKENLSFTGWRKDTRLESAEQSYRKKYNVGRLIRFTPPRGKVPTVGFEEIVGRRFTGRYLRPYLDTVTVGRHKRASRPGKWPPTYLAATVPDRYVSRKAKHLGNTRVAVRYTGDKKKEGVNHPGFKKRDLTDTLLYGTLETDGAGVDLDDFYFDALTKRLNETDGDRSPKFFVEGGKVNYAVKRYIKAQRRTQDE